MLKKAWRLIRGGGWRIFAFELLYRLGWYGIFRFFMGKSLQYALDQKGYSYLTAENFKSFIQSGQAVAALGLGLLFFLFTLGFELSVLFAFFQAGERGEKPGLSRMIHQGGHTFRLLLGRNPLSWIPFSLLLTPYLCGLLLAEGGTQIKFINYLCRYLYGLFPRPRLIALGILLFLLLGFFCLQTLPEALLYGKPLSQALKSSAGRMKKKPGSIGGMLLCQLLVLLIGAAVYMAGSLAMILFVRGWLRKDMALAALLVFCERLRGAAGILAGSLGAMINGAFLLALTGEGREESWPREGMSRTGALVSRMMLWLFASVCLFFGWKSLQRSLSDQGSFEKTALVTAHRGASRCAPENTMAAMEHAVNKLADCVEIDVQETKDKVLVLLHDDSLKRTTGCGKKIWETEYEELQDLDAGGWFGPAFLGEPVPTLEAVLDYCKDKMLVNIELKSNGHNKGIARRVLELVEEKGMEDQCVLTSMNYSFLRQIKELNPEIATGYIMSMAYGDVERLEYADFLSVKHTYVSGDFVTKAHACGKAVHAWTVNSRYDIKRMIMLKVDNLITDRPELAVQLLAEEEGQEGIVELFRYAIRR